MINGVKNLFYSFPLRLLLLHLRSNLLLLFMWIGLVLIIQGQVAAKLGIRYLFLDPEYIGNINFWSFFFLGLALGCFVLTWNLTTYLLNAHYFPFLATLSNPFTKFCINNMLLPLGFLMYYLITIILFQGAFSNHSSLDILQLCGGFLAGFSVLIVLYILYFRNTNRDISHYKKEIKRSIAPGRRNVDVDYIKQDSNAWRVDTFLNERLQPRIVRSVAHYDSGLLKQIFKQNHLNALIIQLLTIIVLMLLGLLTERPYFRLPAGASVFFLLSILTAIIGALIYWFHEWWITVLIILLIGVNYFTSHTDSSYSNKAYGLNYDGPPATYTYNQLEAICSAENIKADKDTTRQILTNWKQRLAGEKKGKPKMVILSVSGGGLRSATWTTRVIQEADSLLGGRLLDHTVLITGASGGMFGVAYMRELLLQKRLGASVDLYDPGHIEVISRDLLNATAFALVTNDFFLPRTRFTYRGHRYLKDRGYIFEQQFTENTNGLLDRSLWEYRAYERAGQIPMLFVTPAIVNDARRMVISPQPVSYMMVPPIGVQRRSTVEIDAVDFGRVFAKQEADQLRFLSALRMNATYPYILPNVHLPSVPEIEVMDAGFRDNYGLASATRFIHVFKDWILENTSGVVLLQISSSAKIEEIRASNRKGTVSALLNPLEIPGQILSLQEFEQDNTLGFIFDLLGEDHFDFVRFMYRPGLEGELQASISFHITEREKQVVLNAIDKERNVQSMRRLIQMLSPAFEQKESTQHLISSKRNTTK